MDGVNLSVLVFVECDFEGVSLCGVIVNIIGFIKSKLDGVDFFGS